MVVVDWSQSRQLGPQRPESVAVLVGISEAGVYEIDPMLENYGSLGPEVIFRPPASGDAVRRMDDGYSRIGLRGRVEPTLSPKDRGAALHFG